VGDTDDEVTDSRDQARRQTDQPHANRWGLDHDIREQEDQDPEEPGAILFTSCSCLLILTIALPKGC
jgi:hypothetical protein